MFGGALDGVESARVTQSTRARPGAVSDGRPLRPGAGDKTLMVHIGPATPPIYRRLAIGLGAALVIALAVLASTHLPATSRSTASPEAVTGAELSPELGPEPPPEPAEPPVAIPPDRDPAPAPDGDAAAVSEVQNPAAGPTAQPGTLVKLREASGPASESSVKPKRKRTRRTPPAQPPDGAWDPNALFPEK